MKLSDILNGISDLKAKGNVNIDISSIACDSRKVMPESLFVAVTGYDQDGHDYIEEAIQKRSISNFTRERK
ncbi:MAG: Mur ligase domain-containing protein [Clostridia bacterium]